jgi:galactokinase
MRTYVVPGRVELVGKHVDYGGGRSLTCAVDLTLRAVASQIAEPVLRVRQVGSRDMVTVPIAPTAAPTRERWSAYPAAVARRIARDFPNMTNGVEVQISSNLPRSAGLSSSTAFTIALTRALVDATGLADDPRFLAHAGTPIQFAEYAAAIETGAAHGPFAADEGVGVRGGAQDHVAIVCARPGMVGQFSYIPAREEGWAPWPNDHALVIAVSGVHAAKTGNARAAYNRASDAVRWLVRQWNGVTYRNDPTLAAALASGADAVERLERIARGATLGTEGAPVSGEYLVRRLAQFREECEVIVPGVAGALREGNLSRVGELVDRSQALAEHALENQVPETMTLARDARQLGAMASSAFGAGFGGAVWAMVAAGRVEEFVAAWRESFGRAFPSGASRARFVVTAAGPALVA